MVVICMGKVGKPSDVVNYIASRAIKLHGFSSILIL